MTFHHFEEELRRVESVIAAMQLINPNQMNHIRKKQVEFKFKENEIQFYFEEAGFTSRKGCVGDAEYFQYVENTNGEARQPRKLFVVND